jgi:hypothetical protein
MRKMPPGMKALKISIVIHHIPSDTTYKIRPNGGGKQKFVCPENGKSPGRANLPHPERI